MKNVFVVAAVTLELAGTPGRAVAQSAADLVAKVLSGQQTRGFSIRSKLVTSAVGSEKATVVQLRTIGRRDGSATRVLYQALWPSAVKGRAVYIQKDRPLVISGFVFVPPDTVTPLTPEVLSRAFLDSELTLDDLAEDFWNWPNPVDAGESRIDGQRCRIVELRPPREVMSTYSRIAGCISAERALPLSIEKFGKDGRLARRFTVKKTVKGEDGRWAPVRIVVENAGRTRTTTIEVSRGEKDVTISPAEFSLVKLKSFAAR